MVSVRYFYGGIKQVLPTSRKEFAILADSGIFFIQAFMDPAKNEWTMPIVNPDEVYLRGQSYSLILEYEKDKFIVSSLTMPDFVKINR